MIKHQLKILCNLLLRQKLISLIIVLGLAVALVSCLLIYLFVRHELTHDQFFTQSDDLYRVSLIATDPAGARNEGASLFYPVAPLLAENFPQMTQVSRLRPHPTLLTSGEITLRENQFRMVDENFFRLFDFSWVEGNPEHPFASTTDVVLTRSMARRYFGAQSALGQTLSMSEGVDLRVSGVIEDLPDNTHLSGSVFASMTVRDIFEPVASRTADWYTGIYHTYVLLQPGTDTQLLNEALASFSEANLPTVFDTTFSLTLDRITDIHLNPKVGDLEEPGSKVTIAIFSAIGFAILLIACINFMNLSTVKSAQRVSETGLRLSLGARRSQLINQFLVESLFFTVTSFLIALVLLEILLPGVQAFLGISFDMQRLWTPEIIIVIAGAILTIGLMAGWYPALVQSSLRPSDAMRGHSGQPMKKLAFRNLLVVVQFSIAIILIISTTTIFSQTRFSRNLDMGFLTEKILVLRTSENNSRNNIQILKQALLLHPDIRQGTLSYSTPLRDQNKIFVFAASDIGQDNHRLAYMPVDFDYFSTFDIDLVSGRFFSENRSTDLDRNTNDGSVSASYLLNVAGAREFGWTPEEAVGKTILRNGRIYRVIGVVADTIESAQVGVFPTIYMIPQDVDPGRYLSVRISSQDMAVTLSFIDRTWRGINGAEPVNREFLDQRISGLYLDADKQMDLTMYFSAIAILLSCMGLFGLSAYTAERRTKEIGIRKVMGGSVWSIVVLLTNDFSKLVLLSNVIAWPVAYFAMNQWLENFAYRIDLTPMIFIGSGLIALCIAWATVGGTAAKAASRKPVLALRYE